MGVAIAVEVEGMRELRRTLKRAGDDLADLTAIHNAVIDLVLAQVRAATPRATGALAGTVRGSGTKTAATVRAGSAAVPYAKPVYFGWPARNIRPNPWIQRTIDRMSGQVLEVYTTGVQRVLDKVEGAAK